MIRVLALLLLAAVVPCNAQQPDGALLFSKLTG